MRPVNIRQSEMKYVTIPIGFEGENEFTQVRINCEDIFTEHPNAFPSMIVTDPLGNKYPVVVTRDSNDVVWNVADSDLTSKGNGEIQIEFIINGNIIGRTDVAKTEIKRSIFINGDAPESIAHWETEANTTLSELNQALQDIPDSINTALAAAKESGEFDGPPGEKGDPGNDAHIYIRYSTSEPSSDQDMKTQPDKWIGIYSGYANSAPEHYTDYVWYMFKGETPDISDKADKTDTILNTTLSRGRIANSTVGANSFAFGNDVEASAASAHAEGDYTVASGTGSHAEGYNTKASGAYSHSSGSSTTASGSNAYAGGAGTKATNFCSHAEGAGTEASGEQSHSEGQGTKASGVNSHAEGAGNIASGAMSHASGGGTEASGNYSHSEGQGTKASGAYSHSEGGGTQATGDYSHVEGSSSQSTGMAGHAEGSSTKASGYSSHAEGSFNEASGNFSHVGGNNNKATRRSQTVFGEYNVYETGDPSTRGSYVEIIGNGIYDTESYTVINSNARALDWAGNEYLKGDVYVGCNNNSTGGVKLLSPSNLGVGNTASGQHSLAAAGMYCTASGMCATASGMASTASGNYSYARGAGGATATGESATAIGSGASAIGNASLAVGMGCAANGVCSAAIGSGVVANGQNSAAFGGGTCAEGETTFVIGSNNYVEDYVATLPEWVPGHYVYGNKVKRTLPNPDYDAEENNEVPENIVTGYMCIHETSSDTFDEYYWSTNFNHRYAFIVGNGIFSEYEPVRSNAAALEWTGDMKLAGDVYVGCNNDSTGGTRLISVSEIATVSETQAIINEYGVAS